MSRATLLYSFTHTWGWKHKKDLKMFSQHDFITYSHTTSGLKWSTCKVTIGRSSDLLSILEQPHISGEQFCKYSLCSTWPEPTFKKTSEKSPQLRNLNKHQTHVCASSMTCALIWLVTCTALHQKRATWLKVLIKSRLNIPWMLSCSFRPETYRMAAFICGWERCVLPDLKNNSGALLLSKPPHRLTDRPPR